MKLKKIAIMIIMITSIFLLISFNYSRVYGLSRFDVDKIDESAKGSTDNMDIANNAVKRVWGTVILVIQILAVSALIIVGIRYMLASADGKADIKNQTVGLVIGIILVFGATIFVNFIVKVTNEVLDTKTRYSNYDNDGYNDWDDVNRDGIIDIYEMNGGYTDSTRTTRWIDLWIADHPEDREMVEKEFNRIHGIVN